MAALAVLALDQLTKFMVYTIWPIPGENELVVIPGFFSLVHWRNLGAAWGILLGIPGCWRWFRWLPQCC